MQNSCSVYANREYAHLLIVKVDKMRFALSNKPSAPVLLVDEQILRLDAPSFFGASEDLSFGLLKLLSYRDKSYAAYCATYFLLLPK